MIGIRGHWCRKHSPALFLSVWPQPACSPPGGTLDSFNISSRLRSAGGGSWAPLWKASLVGGYTPFKSRVSRSAEGQMLALGLCKNRSQCHLVSAAASCDPREPQCLLYISQLFMAPLNKHKISCWLGFFFKLLKFVFPPAKFVTGKIISLCLSTSDSFL